MRQTATAGQPMTRALIYARYSTTLQSDASIEDQVRICRERAQREGWEVAGVFTDAAISGAVRNRPGLNALLAAIGAGDVIVAESIDRLSRDQADIADFFKRVRHADVRIVTLSEGELGKVNIAVNGLMADLYRDNLADKTRRGQTGRVLAGFNPGGLAYGYRRVARFDDRGEPIHGLREIDADQAAVVRQIFTEFLDGRSPRDIARRLNAAGVPGPSGGKWSASSINGDRVRGNGILQNDLYRGLLVFNRTRRTYDPDSRKKRIRIRPEAEWTVRPAPELRIVDDHVWAAVSARRARFDGTRTEQQRRPKRLLSGLVRCGCCGGGYSIVSGEKWGCTNRRQRGDCDNNRTVLTHLLEARVLSGLQEQLLASDVVAEVVREYHRASHERSAEEERARRGLERRRDAARQRVERLLRAVTDGGGEFAEIRDALVRARDELASIETELSNASASRVIALHPGIAEEYRRSIAGLRELLEDPDEDRVYAARQKIRSLVDQVIVSPAASGPGTSIALEGRLAALLGLAGGTPATAMYSNTGAQEAAPSLAYRLKHATV